ncbi:MAG TPA: biosynthetic-type acetolactate synthase large subunit [Candidatus Omnitrophota bacterium]|nr:biosynthetic-type acetolactate synthase large subunit [Candidatus Omnitrophota bacterium]
MELTGAQILVKSLEAEGVDCVFGLPGGAILPTFDAIYDSKIKFHLVRHEQGASHMADAYGRATGKPGVCIVTSGPAATNTITGLATAYMDSAPMVCITGQVATTAIGSDAFQEADVVGVSRPVTKHNYLIKNVKDISRVVKEAFYIARTGRPGPVLIDFPVDVSRAKAEYEPATSVKLRGYNPEKASNPVDMDQLQKAADLINGAKRPCLYVGGGAIISNAEKEVMELVEKTGIPITTTVLGLGIFPETHPLSLRMLGMHGTVYANYSVQKSDVLIAVGARFDDRVTGHIPRFAPHAKIIHIDIDPSSISKTIKVDVAIEGDVKQALVKLNKMVKNLRPATKEWIEQINEWKAKHPLKYKKEGGIRQEYVIEQVGNLTNHKALVATGVGQHQMWAAQWYGFAEPRSMLTSGGLGTMGYGLPAAIGAQCGRPDKTVVCFDGDGSFQMTMCELVTASHYNIPVKLFLLDNGWHGMVRQWQELFYKERYSASHLEPSNPDFPKLVEACGVRAIQCKTKEEVIPAIKEALKHKGPVVVHCLVEKADNVYPMVPAGHALDQVMDMA